ncbi:MAG: YebC/PmpR family DNA-binding transcriptional regulator [Acidobacteria bacterium]|nr:MAG: YebC/PmpR family DNA-binding transcriptional regulator [Acidobacteriota bacterium]
MSGHSKWHSIKHKKGAADAKRGKLFGKLIRQIEVAARQGGGDPKSNPTLATMVQKAKDASMPADNIERAIKRGTGELEGVTYEQLAYEGYGPEGVAILVDVLTDNRNRAASEVRSLFTRNGGNMGEPGSVAWLFDKHGIISIDAGAVGEDDLLEIALEAGAEDVDTEGDVWEVRCPPDVLKDLRDRLETADVPFQSADITMIPQNTVPVSEKAAAQKILKLMDALEDHDDVQAVYANFDIPDEILAEVG